MIRLAILGSESNHCSYFASVLAPKNGDKIFKDVELIGVYADPNEAGALDGNNAVREASTCCVFAAEKNAFLDEADAVMITARNGSKHFEYAENYIKKGIPVWIDKPITCSVSDIEKLVKLANEYGAILSGGSSLEHHQVVKDLSVVVKENKQNIIGGHVTAPVNLDNPYGGFWFYTQHLVGMMISVFGADVKSVRAIKGNNCVHAVYTYDKFTVSAFYGTGYSVSVYTDAYDSISKAFSLPDDYYIPELQTFYDVIKSGHADKSVKDYIAPVYILEATIKSYEKECEIAINIPEKL